MNEIKIYNYKGVGGVRTLEIDGAIWFVGKDIASCLGFKSTSYALGTHVDYENKMLHKINVIGQKRNVTLVNTNGVYNLIMASKLDTAELFMCWVESEVLNITDDNKCSSSEKETRTMVDLEIIEQREVLGQDFKIYGDFENPLFLAKDVAKWIEHTNVTMMLEKIDEDEKVKLSNTYFENRTGGNGTYFLTEDGLYEVLMQSRKPIAKQFKKQVKAILKEIRRTGSYTSNCSNMEYEALENSFKMITEAMGSTRHTLECVQQDLEYTQNNLKDTRNIVIEKDKENAELKKKLNYCISLLSSDNLINIGQIAEEFGLSASALNTYLERIGVQYKEFGTWFIKPMYANKGLAYAVTRDFIGQDNEIHYGPHTKWTQKGRSFIHSTLRENGIVPTKERCKTR